ncbi:hypothetical protein M1L60_24710 [Actinoplanes sp. TRM 88003]|uniref:Uncharacterized protein n=1 Tax=Paractinoplanes aksuensis TaxID=2939490 RepID=A0ABT1DSH7_9ACTN|nr:hypothetical protein [Actinoplanes aksuensis]MCO8273804.1 hypothetical protein [Actinoplanes aksuensis]
MGYVLQCVIAPARVLDPRPPFTNAVVVGLDQGLSLMPMTPDLYDEVSRGDHSFAPAHLFPPGFEDVLSAWSATAPVAYVEAEYFGGSGSQFAAVWQNGALALGPLHLTPNEPRPAPGWSPISHALRHLGASRQNHDDEFDALRLGRHRHTEDWLPPEHQA